MGNPLRHCQEHRTNSCTTNPRKIVPKAIAAQKQATELPFLSTAQQQFRKVNRRFYKIAAPVLTQGINNRKAIT